MINRKTIIFVLIFLVIVNVLPNSMAQFGCISIVTDRALYQVGDTIIIQGTTCKFLDQTPITIKITNPNGNLVTVAQIPLYSSYDFSAPIKTGGSLWSEPGSYRIYAQYGSQDTTGESYFTISSGTTHYTNLSIDLQQGSSSGSIKVYPTLTYDSGTTMPSYSINGKENYIDIYVNGVYKTSVIPNQLSGDITVGYGHYSVYAESPRFTVNSNGETYTEATSGTRDITLEEAKITHTTNLSIDLKQGSSSGSIKVYPTLTYDSGTTMPSYSINGKENYIDIYVNGVYKTSVIPNQLSGDITVGYGHHTVYAESPRLSITSSGETYSGATSNTESIDLQIVTPPPSASTSTAIDPTIFIILGAVAAIGVGVGVAMMKRKKPRVVLQNPYSPPVTKPDNTMFFGCPTCGHNIQIVSGRQYCPNCRIYL
jgi:hypothetical protein